MQAMQKRLKELQEVYGLLGGCEVRLKAACKAQDVLLVSQVCKRGTSCTTCGRRSL